LKKAKRFKKPKVFDRQGEFESAEAKRRCEEEERLCFLKTTRTKVCAFSKGGKACGKLKLLMF
jgi:hypothetical protein